MAYKNYSFDLQETESGRQVEFKTKVIENILK